MRTLNEYQEEVVERREELSKLKDQQQAKETYAIKLESKKKLVRYSFRTLKVKGAVKNVYVYICFQMRNYLATEGKCKEKDKIRLEKE